MQEEWRPHAKQEEALQRPEFEVLFGGARGGGKTDTGLVWLIGEEFEEGKVLLEHPRYRALVIRKNAEDLSDWIDRAYRFYSSFGVDIAYKPAVLRFPSGAVIRTGHLKDDQSYTKYMGQEFPRILLEELTQIPLEKRYLQLIASCRSTIPEIRPQVFGTTNPGGLGHGWVKKRFIDPSPAGVPFGEKGRRRIYIPATLDDNPTLKSIDPDYVKTLDDLKETDEELWKAWRLGSWDTFAGMFFREFDRELHLISPFMPDPKRYPIVGGMDWGYSAPFSFHLAEVRPHSIDGLKFFRTRTFMEIYGTNKTPKDWSPIIKTKMAGMGLTFDDIAWIRGDPAMFNTGTDGSISIRDQFVEENPGFMKIVKGSNDRIPGWVNMRNWLSSSPDGFPYWQITNNCVNLIKEISEAIYDENKIEDLAGEYDHALDGQRYMLKSLKWLGSMRGAANSALSAGVASTKRKIIDPYDMSFLKDPRWGRVGRK